MVGASRDFTDRSINETYIVTRVEFGGDCVMAVDKVFEPGMRLARSSVNTTPEVEDFTLIWQSPHKLWTTEATCWIGALVAPLLNPEVIIQWYKMEGKKKEPMEISSPFICVTPGIYTGLVSCFKDGVKTTGMLHPINVKSAEDVFEGVKIFKSSEYTVFDDLLRKGGFGHVVRGSYFGPIAVKKMEATVSKEVLDAEICTASLHHRNLVKILGVCTYPNEIHILMELVYGENLKKIMLNMVAAAAAPKEETIVPKMTRSMAMESGKSKPKKAKLPPVPILNRDQIYFIIQQISCGLAFLHDNGVVHSDIKPANIMVTKENQVKITDFSIARVKRHAAQVATDATTMSQASRGPGTLPYMAPEVYKPSVRRKRRQASVDIWALGIITTELLNDGQRCFEDDYHVCFLVNNKTQPEGVENLPIDLQPIVKQALSHEPTDRPTARDYGKAIGQLYDERLYFQQVALT